MRFLPPFFYGWLRTVRFQRPLTQQTNCYNFTNVPNSLIFGCRSIARTVCGGSVAEWSKALDLGSSLSGCVGSNPTAAKTLFYFEVPVRNPVELLVRGLGDGHTKKDAYTCGSSSGMNRFWWRIKTSMLLTVTILKLFRAFCCLLLLL